MDFARLDSASVPLVEVTRGRIVESVHSGAAVVVDAAGHILASCGDPQLFTFMRSSAKPFQALPFVKAGGDLSIGLTRPELALVCASHTGTDEHVRAALGIQAKAGISEEDLRCGVHPPTDKAAWKRMQCEGTPLTANRNNCSGKHSGMLAYARLLGVSTHDYLDTNHPVQQAILAEFSRMCALEPGTIELGVDGCSAPNFAVPLYNAAYAFARFMAAAAGEQIDSSSPGDDAALSAACLRIVEAMTMEPLMVGGPGRFDSVIMQALGGRVLAKMGAEGYQCFGFRPDALGPGSPPAGAAIKILDGDLGSRGRVPASMEVLRQIGAMSAAEAAGMTQFGPCTLENWAGLTVGAVRPVFKLGK